MKCYICDHETYLEESDDILCSTCKQLHKPDLFSKMLAILIDIYYTDKKQFEAIKSKCAQFETVIQEYCNSTMTPLFKMDSEAHEKDKTALQFLRTYTTPEDGCTFQNFLPVKIEAPDNTCLYKTIAFLCQLDSEDGAKELRVRNIIDMVLHAEVYHSFDPELYPIMKHSETWHHYVLEQLREKESMDGINAIVPLCLHSLSTMINMKIRSIYPITPHGNSIQQKQLNRVFCPLKSTQSDNKTLPTIHILWSNMKEIRTYSSSTTWMPNCVVPVLLKPDASTSSTDKIDSRDQASRDFYILLPCQCSISQSLLSELVSDADRKKRSEAQMTHGDTTVPEFGCPKCSRKCNDYILDHNAITLFRQNFTGARFTYILVDITSSMSSIITKNKNNSPSRIDQTKEAVKQLLIEIAKGAGEDDRAILSTFDDKLTTPELIPLCPAIHIAQPGNLARIDGIKLSPWSKSTHLYSTLKEVYEMLAYKSYLYVDTYIFSDGLDTSPHKNDTAFQAIIRELNEKIGAKCRFLDCGSGSERFSVVSWLGDKEAYRPISGNKDEIRQQIKSCYDNDHPKKPHNQEAASQISIAYMTDAEAASIVVPHRKISQKPADCSTNSSLDDFYTTAKNINDNLTSLHSPNTPPNPNRYYRSDPSAAQAIRTVNPGVKRPIKL